MHFIEVCLRVAGFCCCGGVGEAAAGWVIGAGVMMLERVTRLATPCQEPNIELQFAIVDVLEIVDDEA
jgi:hypothetical protein